MHCDTWQDQSIEHLWQSEVMFETGTQQTCVMQVKSNDHGESINMQDFDGNQRNGSKGTKPVRTGISRTGPTGFRGIPSENRP